VCCGRAGESAPRLGAEVNLDSGLSGQCLRTGEVLNCEDSESDSRVQHDVCRALGIRSVLVVPIRGSETVVGIIEVFSPLVGAFTDGEVRGLELLSGLAAERLGAAKQRDDTHQAQRSESEPAIPSGLVESETPPQATEPVRSAHPNPTEAAAALALLLQKAEQVHRAPRWLKPAIAALAVLALSGPLVHKIGWGAPTSLSHDTAVVETPRTPPLSKIEPPAVSSGPPLVSAVEFQYQADSTIVVIHLTSPAAYEAQRLTDPERVYFDIPGTRVSPEFLGSGQVKTLVVADRLLTKVRVANKTSDGVRVVLDLNCECDFSALVSPSAPYRLTVELRSPGPGSKASKTSGRATTLPHDAPYLPTAESRARSTGLRVVIDPGHGGWDRGTVGPSGLEEKDLVLDVAQRLGKMISARLSAEVIYTRTDDTFIPLESRSAMANSAQADLFVSIHGNSSDYRSVRGVETFYMDPGSTARLEVVSATEKKRSPDAVTASRQLAAAVQHALYTKLSADDPDLRNRGVKPAPLVVLVGPSMPSVLSEISFLSSPAEEQRLKTSKYRDRIAEALYEGIHNYVTRANLHGHYLASMPARATPAKAQ